jgi:hypothetical protein
VAGTRDYGRRVRRALLAEDTTALATAPQVGRIDQADNEPGNTDDTNDNADDAATAAETAIQRPSTSAA